MASSPIESPELTAFQSKTRPGTKRIRLRHMPAVHIQVAATGIETLADHCEVYDWHLTALQRECLKGKQFFEQIGLKVPSNLTRKMTCHGRIFAII